ncbi:MAG TPA: GTP-binding protein [Thermoplasmata archaeon]|nr:GTP-binding protein [Thermoplasmata archaeon]
MKVIVCAGPPTSGKTTVLKQVARRLRSKGHQLAYLKTDVQFTNEDEQFRTQFGIPAKKVYSGELCPDHCNVMVLGDAVRWAASVKADTLLVETAGLCLRCSPYIEDSLGVAVLEATSGMNLPRKIGPLLSLADVALVTKIDLVSQAEREVFRANVLSATQASVIETDALHGINIDRLVRRVEQAPDLSGRLLLRGNPPVGVCTICVGKKEVGWQQHFGVVRQLEGETFYRGE